MELNLNELQIDALKEIGNIGAGNAATALSQLINKKVDMSVPQLDILEFSDMIKRVGNEDDEVVAVLLKVFGDIQGNILFLVKNEEAQKFFDTLMFGFSNINEEMFYSMFQEIGNILGNSYLNAVSQITNLSLLLFHQ
ncbi:chemotaxis protein CheC [Thermobrachium celere]|uniref:Chemotaxis protein CheC--inhibitor of MCP methylation n=1 Tax=Thermobrachium celere DSM 8682 TaxID=941824 RepID=R7RRS1_9CLOT|nr:chemotaxis protein CheC [Thermobrachium celere]CDF58041.1 Chemotaxis protein CheC--inhibitor of MCP methylation [Thermobrachium celere DSM 8682]